MKLSAFGDVVHTIPVLHALRRRYPAARIDWLVMAGNAALIAGHPALDRVVAFDDKAWRTPSRLGWRNFRTLWAFGRDLRRARYDLVIDLQGQFRSAACVLLTAAPVRIGFARPRRRAAANGSRIVRTSRHGWTGAREGAWHAYTHTIPLDTLDLHAVDRYLRVGRLLGFEANDPDFSFPIAPEAEAGALTLLHEHGLAPGPGADPFLLIAPGTIWDTKQWTPAGFAEVARHFLGRNLPVVLAGAPRDRAVSEAIARDAPGTINLCGRTSQGELAALTRHAAAVLANDSGPMHLAVALGRPVVAIFGPTDPLWAGPYRHPEAVAAAGVACAPCYIRELRRCPHGHACMRELAAAAVIAKLEAMLRPAAGTQVPGAGAA